MSFMTGLLVITTGNYRLLYISSVDYGNATVDSYEFLITNFIGYDKTISRLQETIVTTVALHSTYTFSTGTTGTTVVCCSLLQSVEGGFADVI